MGIRRCKKAINLDALVYFPGKAGKLGAVHIFAGIFIQPPFGSRQLGRTGGNANNDLIWL